MALLDLSAVTKALVEFLKAAVSSSPAWPFSTWGAPQVVGLPPDLLEPGSLGVYLYHVTEEAHLKNQPPVSRDAPPVRFTPMGLSLYYQLTAVGLKKDETGVQQEQVYLGCALKAFHDYPVIDDSTVVLRRVPPPAPPTAVSVLRAAGLDGEHNRLRISLQPVPFDQASTYWSSSSLVPRLAAYYQVSVVLLGAEPPASLAGRVLRFGVQSLVGGAPRLDASENKINVVVPGFAAQELTARPAEVPFGGELVLVGFNLTGDATRLSIQHVLWAERVEVDAAWGVIASEGRVFCTVQLEAEGRPVQPGLYAAQVTVVRRRTLPDGSTREFAVSSNDTPFSICARISAPTLAGDVGTLKGHAFTQLDPTQPPFPANSVRLFIADIGLSDATASAASLNPGEFKILDSATIEFRLPPAIPAGKPVSLRLFVLGAESAPQWFTP